MRSPFTFLTFLLSMLLGFTANASFTETLNSFFGAINGAIASVMFADVLFFTDELTVPLAVIWLIIGAVFFTLYMNFINLRGFVHAIAVVRGKYDDDSSDEIGEVTHFQALSAALSATVGLGNIAGVAIAISIGGPGAMFWMIVAGFLGMSSKFTECTLAQIYREKRSDGHVLGGPMEYLDRGFKELGGNIYPALGKFLSVFFALLCIGGSFAGGGAFQVNQSLGAIKVSLPILESQPWIYGLIITILVAIVIIGGIKRIAHTAEAIVPAMCGIYILACLWILGSHFSALPDAVMTIFSTAFSHEAGIGGVIGVLIVGFKRAAFSNEAGVGSAAIAHSAAKTNHPAREGIVSLLEPFIDTIVVCSMTALVIVVTGAYDNPDWESLRAAGKGAALTSAAFGSVVSWFPMVLSVAVFLFAFSTIISWSYYGERCWVFLFGEKTSIVYKLMLLVAIFLGALTSATNVLEFGDLMILGMAFPNIFGLYFLAPKVKRSMQDYMSRLAAGEYKQTS